MGVLCRHHPDVLWSSHGLTFVPKSGKTLTASITSCRLVEYLSDLILFQDDSLSQNRVGVVQRMFVGIRDAVRTRLSSSSSLDYYSRQAAMDKLSGMTVQVGTPDILTDRKFLKIMYKDLSVQKTDFFQNIQYGMAFIRRREEHELVSPGEETRWLRFGMRV